MNLKITSKQFNAMPTYKLAEILASHHCTGIDGADYEPVKAYLEAEYWKRLNNETDKLMDDYNREQKQLFNHMYKKGKAS